MWPFAEPAFDPSNWLFAPVWTLLYVLIAVAGWRVSGCDRGGWLMKLWWAALGLNFLWSPTFFAAHQIGVAFGVILLLLAIILAFVCTAWRRGCSFPMAPGSGSHPCSTLRFSD
ncbi:MAG: TspO/MBR family protein [Hyphomicrobiaceae bacterium]|jgi:tryptophan-rich sensory protein